MNLSNFLSRPNLCCHVAVKVKYLLKISLSLLVSFGMDATLWMCSFIPKTTVTQPLLGLDIIIDSSRCNDYRAW